MDINEFKTLETVTNDNNQEANQKLANYDKIGSGTGIPAVGAIIYDGDIVMRKTTVVRKAGPITTTTDSKTSSKDEKKADPWCPHCQEPGTETSGLLHCCQRRVCSACVFKIVFPKGASVCTTCPFCKQDARAAVMRKVQDEKRRNPNEAHIKSFISAINGVKLPISYSTTARDILKVLSAKAGFNLIETEGSFVDYKVVFRDRNIPLDQTLSDAAHWRGGIAPVEIVCSRTPACWSQMDVWRQQGKASSETSSENETAQ